MVDAHRQVQAEMLRELLPERRLRRNPRVVKRKMSGYHVKRDRHRDWPQPALPPTQAVRIAAPAGSSDEPAT